MNINRIKEKKSKNKLLFLLSFFGLFKSELNEKNKSAETERRINDDILKVI